MTARQLRVVACRVPALAFWVITAVYALLAYIPFTYHQVIEFRLIGWLDVFARYHGWWALAAWALATCSLLDDLREEPRPLTIGFVFITGLAGAALLVLPVLATIGNDTRALWYAAAALVPLLWLAAIDWAAAVPRVTWQAPEPEEDARLVVAAVTAGIVTSALAAAAPAMRGGAQLPEAWPAAAIPWLHSLAYHMMLFGALAAVLLAIRAAAAWFRRPSLVEFALAHVAAAAILAFLIERIVLNALSVAGAPATMVSVAGAAAIVAAVAGLSLRVAPSGRPVTSGVELGTRLLGGAAGGWWILGTIAVLGGLAYGLPAAAAVMDWDFLLQQLAAAIVALVTFAVAHGALRPRAGRVAATVSLAIAAGVALGGYHALHAFQPQVERTVAGRSIDVAALLDRYAGYDASFRLLHGRLRVAAAREDIGDRYVLLQRHTNIPRTVAIDLPEIDLAARAPLPDGPRPHIFIIAIDSLRQDYLAPYNPAVAFTPRVAEFARDAAVFRQAFTHYGATGLAEPSIWTGSLLPHQQYPPAFARVNALRKLLVDGGYTSFVSMDTILRATVDPWPGLSELDAGIANKDYRLCGSLGELGARLRARPAGAAGPVFAYTQPQDIHVATITREGKSAVDGGAYAGFYAPYASRVRRMDACFGTFLDTLRETGLYDRSIIVLTSDHGDSLGEDGRWGHAYTVFPEVARVPLIVRLPPDLRGLPADPDAIAFTTDITPSLYHLLGRRPTQNHPLLGRPLFTADPAERQPYLRDSHVIASSYGPVYGWIGDGGRSLYIIDATSYRDWAYDLTTGTAGTPVRVTPDLRLRGGRAIEATIHEIARVYRVPVR